MKKLLYLIIISFLFTQCYFDSIDTVNYVGFYDDEQQKIKVNGKFINQKEHGAWNYFNEDGVLVQHGRYSNGLQYEKWIYNYIGFVDTLNWVERKYQDEIIFSLPDNFTEIMNTKDEGTFTARDSISGNIFYIKIIPDISKDSVLNFFDENYSAFAIDYNIIEACSNLIRGEGLEYFLDSYSLVHKATAKELCIYMLYKQINNEQLVLGIASYPKEKEKAKFIIGDVFNHSWYNKQRVADPFKEVFVTSK